MLTAVLARQAAAAVDVGTCWSWETAYCCCYVAVLGEAPCASAPTGRRGVGHIVAAARLQLVLIIMKATEGQGKSIIAYRKLQCSECISFRFLSIPYVEGISDMYPLAPEPIRQTGPKPYHFFRWYGFVCKMPTRPTRHLLTGISRLFTARRYA